MRTTKKKKGQGRLQRFECFVEILLFTEIYCPALEDPFRGFIAPTTCTDERSNIRRSTVCKYGCEVGHNLTGGDSSLVCQIDGFWHGRVPYCKRKQGAEAKKATKVSFPLHGEVVSTPNFSKPSLEKDNLQYRGDSVKTYLMN